MLRIIQNSHVGGAKSYYSTADYYTEGQELTGRWRGIAARKLGLWGDVGKDDWDALCDNLHPRYDTRLMQREKTNRTVGYDFNFHVPKSVSVLYAMTRDDRILDAFREAVGDTMEEIEAESKTRVRRDGKNEDRTTGNLVWGEFVHFTSRPVDGVPDPHLHAHCFVFNTTWDDREERWKAGQFRDLKRDAPYFEAVFHSRFARNLAELGLPIERTAKAWELEGLPASAIERFSRRTTQIEELAKEKDITDADQKAKLGAKTRNRKARELSFPELQAEWRGRMTTIEGEALSRLEQRLGGEAQPADERAAVQAMEQAVSHCFERKSVVPERQLLATALRRSVGKATAEQVHQQVDAQQVIVGERQGRRMATTRTVLAEERKMIGFARAGRGTCRPMGPKKHRFQTEWLNESQKRAVQHILESRDRVILVRGVAGTGKTTLLKEAVDGIQANGTKVFAFAPSADASRGVLREAGFPEAETVAKLLVDKNLQHEAQGALIWIDEAGLLGTKTMEQVFRLAEKLDARVLLTGDRKQHGAVERGAALRLLEQEAGLVPADVKEIQRQKGDYKAAVAALSEGEVEEGFRRLDDLGWIREIPEQDRYRQLAADYVESVRAKKSALVISPTHREGGTITREIRQALQAERIVERKEHEIAVLRNARLTEAERGDPLSYGPGDVLQFHQNAKGFRRGERIAIGEPHEIPLDQSQRFTVFRSGTLKLAAGDVVRITHNGTTADGKHRLNNGTLYRVREFADDGDIVLDNGWKVGRDFGHLDYGYVVTSHASQGKSVDRVFIGQAADSFPASSREQFYVSVSRGKEQATIYCDSKEGLREAVSQVDERLSATEFVGGNDPRLVIPLRQQREAVTVERNSEVRKELDYER